MGLPLLLLCNVHVHGLVNIKHFLLLPGELGEDIQVLLPLSTRVTHNRSKLYRVHTNSQPMAQSIRSVVKSQHAIHCGARTFLFFSTLGAGSFGYGFRNQLY